jgi:cystathionine beta-lyase
METALGALKAMGKGTSVAMNVPVYGPFYGSTRQNEMEIKGVEMIHEGADWKMNFEGLEEVFKAGTKIMLFCNPHNPVGRIWTREELEQLVALTRKYDVTIISDEIHADLEMPGYKNTCMLNVEPKSIVFVSATKTFNLAALRHSSLLITDPELKEQVKKEFYRRGNGGINMFGRIAQTAAYQGGEEWLDALLEYLAGTRDMVEKFLAEELPEVGCARLMGTYLMWLDFRYLGLEQKELVRLMVEEAGIGFSSGTDFGVEGTGFMRMNIATPRSNVMKALQQIKAVLKK